MEESGNALTSGPDGTKRRVSYFYDSDIGNYYYSQGHPMKPHRIRMAHSLIMHYGLHEKMEICRPTLLQSKELRVFHADDYINFLQSVTPETQHEQLRQLKRFNVGEDCPVFDGLYNFCQTYAGGSVGAAVKLNNRDADIAINWAGGLHHAKRCEASGFCYVNDIVLAILELLKVHQRVLYIDIDIHHGDGVEEAFYTTDRVMSVSFHKFGDYFPGTGHLKDVGHGKGKYYSLNVPLNDGIDDESYKNLFRPIIQKVMEVYHPEAVVLQCGADSLSGDRLGCFNLSVKGHADCVRFLRSFNVPLLLVGGGGYTIRNVARCWCYETAVAVGVEPQDKLPYNEYYEYFGPDYTLHVAPSNMENQNTVKELAKIRNTLLEQLRKIQHVPSVPFQERPPDTKFTEEEEEDYEKRTKGQRWDGEYYGSESEEDQKPRNRDADATEKPHLRRSAPSIFEPSKKVKQEVEEEEAEIADWAYYMRPSGKSAAFTYAQMWPQSTESLSILEDISLTYLAFADYIYHDWDMLTALMERWNPNTNTFHLPTGEITMTLEDVYRITRLPIRGKLVNMAPVPSMERAEEWATWLTGSGDVNHRKRGVSLMRHTPEDAPARYDLRLRLLIACLLDAIVYPDKSSETFPVGMVPIIRDMVQNRQRYAWCPAILAQLYHDLHSFAEVERGGRQVAHSMILQVWAYDHIIISRPTSLLLDLPDDTPTWQRWATERGPDFPDVDLEGWRVRLDLLQESQVYWRPYQYAPEWDEDIHELAWVRHSIYLQARRALVEPYRPERVLRQFGIQQGIPDDCGIVVRYYRNRDFSKDYIPVPDWDSEWESPSEDFDIEADPAVDGPEHTADYLDWWSRHSPHYIGIHEADRSEESAEDEEDTGDTRTGWDAPYAPTEWDPYGLGEARDEGLDAGHDDNEETDPDQDDYEPDIGGDTDTGNDKEEDDADEDPELELVRLQSVIGQKDAEIRELQSQLRFGGGGDYASMYQDLHKANARIQDLYEQLRKVERQVGEEKARAEKYKARCGGGSSSRATSSSVGGRGSSRRY